MELVLNTFGTSINRDNEGFRDTQQRARATRPLEWHNGYTDR